MNWKTKQCESCEGMTEAMTKEMAQDFMPQIPAWDLAEDGSSISRRFEFKGFSKVMMFLNAMAWIVQAEGHHPDVAFGYNYCQITFTTHALKGLSENDFICVAKLNTL